MTHLPPTTEILLILIDGSNAGGQLVRTATALSTLTEKSFKMVNIRGARPNPGLKTQHIEAIKSLGKLCNAEVKGLKLYSQELEFYPKGLGEKDLKIKISTAGSIGLVLQAVMIATSKMKGIEIEIDGGGTWNKWAPPVLYLEKVFFPLMGEKSKIKIIKDGFYPRGGAKVKIQTKYLESKPIEIVERGEIVEICGHSVASQNLKKAKVGERQGKKAEELIKQKFNRYLKKEVKYVNSLSPGSGLLLYIKTGNSVIGADSLGKRGKRAEDVAKDAIKNLIFEYANGAVDRHMGDMLLPYMALAGSGKIKTSEITHHILTNISIIEKFLPVKFDVNKDERLISCKTIRS